MQTQTESKNGFRHTAQDVASGFAAFLEQRNIIREMDGTITLCLGFNISNWRKSDLRAWYLDRVGQ